VYWLCYDDSADPCRLPPMCVIYAAEAPDHDNAFGYDSEAEAVEAMHAEQDFLMEVSE
jgi:hypothetical protein